MNKKVSTVITTAIVVLSMIFASNVILGLGEYKSIENNITLPEEEYILTINIDGTGDGTVDPPTGGTYIHGTNVTLTPFPDFDSDFTDWSGPNVNDLLNNGDGTWNITMDDNKSVTATFNLKEYTLIINTDGTGSGTVTLDPPGGVYEHYTNVTLTANENFDSDFIEWSDDLTGSINPDTIIMDDDKMVTATFDKIPIPGVDIFEWRSETLIGSDTNDVIKTDMDDIFYGKTMNIEVNEGFNWNEKHYLYYPEYTGKASSGDYALEWIQWESESGQSPSIDTHDLIFENVKLNYTGMWLIGPKSSSFNPDISNMEETIPAWFWVNGSEVLDIQLSDSTVHYNESKDITINVTKDGKSIPLLIDVRYKNDTIFKHLGGNIWADDPNGEYTFSTENFTFAGEYEVFAYRDIDDTVIFYGENPKFYNDIYGKDTIENYIEEYDYILCGPWDSPEYIAETKIITVETNEPNIIVDPNILYFGFRNTLYINITDDEGNGLDNIGCLRIKNDKDINVTEEFNGNITSGEKPGDFEIAFPHGEDKWDDLGGTGTWHISYDEDINGDGILERSHKESFTVRGESQGVTIYVTDDGDGNRDMKVNVPVFDETNIQPINISFRIYGESIEDVFDEKDDITVSGDILEEATLNHDTDKNIWHVEVIPKNPGKIIVSVEWEDMGSDSISIDIINGTYVSTDITAFPVGKDVTISVTVKDKDDDYVKYSRVSLFWKDNGALTEIDTITGDGTEEKGKNGIYVFVIDKDKQGNSAPKDIYVTANTPQPNYWGYAKITMERNHELIINCSPLVSYAGDGTLYDIEVTTADDAEPDNIVVELYREDDDPNEDDPERGPWNGNSFEDKKIILDVGRYYFYAHNDTHDNKENNTILVIHPYTISCSPSVLAWNIDTETDITFTVTPAGDGTLTIINITGNDVSYDNDGEEGGTCTINIENGTGTLEEITASSLGNITFKYQPNGGVKYPAEGMLRVTTATATPNPSTVYVNEPITVTITVTHPATGKHIPDVDVGLQSNILVSQPDNETTDANGRVQFGITTGGSGDIIILIEGESDPDNKFVIESKLRKTMIIDAPLTIEEGDTFIVNIKTPTGDLVTDLVTIEFADNTFTTSTGTLQLTAPMVSTDTDYRIRASATDYYNDEDTIRVIPKPELKQLHIIIYDFTGIGTTKFKVIVTDDTGRSITGASITFNGKEYQTSSDGVELTAPNEKRTYEITASFTGYESVSKSVTVTKLKETPGFELLALIAALGICFILLKRRRK